MCAAGLVGATGEEAVGSGLNQAGGKPAERAGTREQVPYWGVRMGTQVKAGEAVIGVSERH